MPKGTEFCSNPFQVLGVSDPPTDQPKKNVDLDEVAPVIHVPLPPAGANNPEDKFLENQKSSTAVGQIARPAQAQSVVPVAPALPSVVTVLPVAPEPVKHLSWLHKLGTFFLDSVLPVALQIAVPVLTKEL